jgi:hypothetical protein
MESFFLLAGSLLFDEKSSKVLHKPSSSQHFWVTPNRPVNMKFMASDFFGGQFGETEDSLQIKLPTITG